MQRAVPFAVLAPGGQSGNFWLHRCMWSCVLTKEKVDAPITVTVGPQGWHIVSHVKSRSYGWKIVEK